MPSDMDGEMVFDTEMTFDGEMPAGDMPSDMDGGMTFDTEMVFDTEMTFEEEMSSTTGTITTTLIPVGVTVHTTSDTTTTFSRLAEGDLLELLLETDADGNEVIVEIWMVL